MTYEHLRKKAIYEINRLTDMGYTKIAVYPFGDFGSRVCDTMVHEIGLEPYMIIDDKKASSENAILSIDEAVKKITPDTVVLICTDSYLSKYYYEIRTIANTMFAPDIIVDLTPVPVFSIDVSFPKHIHIVDYDVIKDPIRQMENKRVVVFGTSCRTEEILKILSWLDIPVYKLICVDCYDMQKYASLVECEEMDIYTRRGVSDHSNEFIIVGDTDEWYPLLQKLDSIEFDQAEVITTYAFYRSMLHHRESGFEKVNRFLDTENRANILQHDLKEKTESVDILRNQLKEVEVLVYQPGKVGSMSINFSLLAAGCNSLHIHSFYEYDWDSEFTEEEQEKIENRFTTKKFKIVTMVRNPIPRDISMFMQIIQEDIIPRHRCTMEWTADENGNEILIDKNFLVDPDLAAACRKFIRHQTDYQFDWFDRELKKTFGVDVYKYPFDKEKGYMIIKEGNVEVLLMRCESINRLENVIRDFCEVSQFKLTRTNDGGQKEDRFIYEELKNRIRLSPEYVSRYLNNKKALHFYSKEEILAGARRIDKGL